MYLFLFLFLLPFFLPFVFLSLFLFYFLYPLFCFKVKEAGLFGSLGNNLKHLRETRKVILYFVLRCIFGGSLKITRKYFSAKNCLKRFLGGKGDFERIV